MIQKQLDWVILIQRYPGAAVTALASKSPPRHRMAVGRRHSPSLWDSSAGLLEGPVLHGIWLSLEQVTSVRWGGCSAFYDLVLEVLHPIASTQHYLLYVVPESCFHKRRKELVSKSVWTYCKTPHRYRRTTSAWAQKGSSLSAPWYPCQYNGAHKPATP